ncbi:hypothetical protein PRUB_a1861 [Pseudoalteromonas rubra]|uniref:Uncharacterized protein n=1 Tax=Pseudoalteromonas rubra TaxID=43658 RepID=A0A8T0CGQ9_9GAMM|nr:hypothetical protein PRUB_a1861 [Pseudoalteromonas rubra]
MKLKGQLNGPYLFPLLLLSTLSLFKLKRSDSRSLTPVLVFDVTTGF